MVTKDKCFPALSYRGLPGVNCARCENRQLLTALLRMYQIEAMRVVCLIVFLLSPSAEACPHGCSCPSSRKVGCYNASLTSVPQDLFNEDVITLDLSHNAITELEEDSFKTYRLRYLFLNDNCITSVFERTFWSLPALHNLFLNNNKITHIHHFTFRHNTMLKELDLSENQLTSLSDSTFTYTNSLMILNLSGNRLTSLNFVIPMTMDQTVSKKLTLQAANNTLKNLAKDTLRALGRFMKFDISNNTELLCPCQGRQYPCSEYTQNWNEYVVLCLQKDNPPDLYDHLTTKPSILETPVTSTVIERKETTTISPSTTERLKVESSEGKALEKATMVSLSKLELTIVVATLSLTLVVILVVTITYFILCSKVQKQEDSSSDVRNDLKRHVQDDDGTSDRRASYAEVNEGLKKNLIPHKLHLVTPVELNEPLYQAESVGSFIYTPPSEVYFDFSTTSTRQLPSTAFYSQGRVPLERGFSNDSRSIYDPGIYAYDHIYEEIT